MVRGQHSQPPGPEGPPGGFRERFLSQINRGAWRPGDGQRPLERWQLLERDGVSRGTETSPGRGKAKPEESAILLRGGSLSSSLFQPHSARSGACAAENKASHHTLIEVKEKRAFKRVGGLLRCHAQGAKGRDGTRPLDAKLHIFPGHHTAPLP